MSTSLYPSEYDFTDTLIRRNTPFALYRLPNDTTVQLVVQQRTVGEPVRLTDIGSKAGFVVAPFIASADLPVVLIHPDLYIKGSEELHRFAASCMPIPAIESSEATGEPDEEDAATYRLDFDRFHAAVTEGRFGKLVLARSVTQRRKPAHTAASLFAQAEARYPDAFVYLLHTPQSGTWLGCSPELLLAEVGGTAYTVALAGTREALDTLPAVEHWDAKNRHEQQLVTDYIVGKLADAGIESRCNPPRTVQAGRLIHLCTDIRFELTPSHRLGDVLASLHPTPAVCGTPKEDALRFIAATEHCSRQYYTGFVGPTAIDGATRLYVNLRSMRLYPDRLQLYAGGGILPGSTANGEWAETEAKLQTLRTIIDSIHI